MYHEEYPRLCSVLNHSQALTWRQTFPEGEGQFCKFLWRDDSIIGMQDRGGDFIQGRAGALREG